MQAPENGLKHFSKKEIFYVKRNQKQHGGCGDKAAFKRMTGQSEFTALASVNFNARL